MESEEEESFLAEESRLLKARWQKLCKAVQHNAEAARSQAQRKGSYVCCVSGGKRHAGAYGFSVQCISCFGWAHGHCVGIKWADFEQVSASDFKCKFCEQQEAKNANAHHASEAYQSDRGNQDLDDADQYEEGLLSEHELEAFLQSDKCYTCGYQAKLGSVFRCKCGKTFHPNCEYTDAQLTSVAGSARKCRLCRGKEQYVHQTSSDSEHFDRSQVSPFQTPVYPLPCPCGVQKAEGRIECVRCRELWHLSCAKESLDTCADRFVCAVCVNKELSALRAERNRLSHRDAGSVMRPPAAGILKSARTPQQRAVHRSHSPSRAAKQPRCARCDRPAQGAESLGKYVHCRRLLHARCGEVALSSMLSQIGCDGCRRQRMLDVVHGLFPASGDEGGHKGIADRGKGHANPHKEDNNMRPIKTSTPLPTPHKSEFKSIAAPPTANNADFAALMQQLREVRAELSDLRMAQRNDFRLDPGQPPAPNISVSDLPWTPTSARTHVRNNPHVSIAGHARNPATMSDYDPVLDGDGRDDGAEQQMKKLQLNADGTKAMEGVTQSVVEPSAHSVSLPAEVRMSYASVREELLLRLANDEQGRTSSMVDLLNGKPRAQHETIEAFGDRILRMVRSACTPNCPSEQVEELCKSYFLQWIGDRELVPSLTEQRNHKPYRYLVDHAATLRRSLDLLQPMTPSAQHAPAQQNNYRWNGYAQHAARSAAPSAQSTNAPQFTAQSPHAATHANAQTKQNQGYNYNAPARQPFVPNAAKNNSSSPFPKVAGCFSKSATADPPNAAQTPASPAAQSNKHATWNVQTQYANPYVPPSQNNGFNATASTLVSSAVAQQQKIPAIGPSADAIVRVEGMPCRSLYDTGASITVMEAGCLKGLLMEKGVIPDNWPLDPPSTSVSVANKLPLNLVSSTVLRIARGDVVAHVRVQLTTEALSYPLIIGTNALGDLGISLIDSRAGCDLLRPQAVLSAMHVVKPEVSVCAVKTVAPGSARFLEVSTEMPDGDYVFSQEVGSREDTLVCVTNGQANVCISNWGHEPLVIDTEVPLGQLELIEHILSVEECTDLRDSTVASVNLATAGGENIERPPTDPQTRLALLWKACDIEHSPLSDSQKTELRGILLANTDSFALDTCELTGANVQPIRLELLENKVIKCSETPIPYALRRETGKILQAHKDQGIIADSLSQYCSPTVVVRKKDNSLRFCTDLRRVNRILKCPAYPIPNCENVLLMLGKKRYFTSLDLKSGYFQLKLHPDSAPLTAFAALGRQYQYNVLPMGLNGSPAFFQQTMNRVFEGLIGDKMIVYLDDLLCASSTWEEHIKLLKEVFRRLKNAGLKLHPSKCRFAVESAKFLGHVLCSEGIKKDEDKTRPLRELPVPHDVKSVQSALGIFGYYRKFVRDYAQIATPLYALTKKGVAFEWTLTCQEAFERLVEVMCEDVTLAFPDFEAASTDPNRRLTIQCDASREGLGAVLCQLDEENRMRPIYFISRMTSHAEKKYEGITVLEAAAVRFAVKKWAAYIIGLPTVVETDHVALVSMFTKDKECGNARVDKWAMEIKSRFDLHFVYKAGKTHVVADGLSRSVAKNASFSVITRSAARRLEPVREETVERVKAAPPLDEVVLEIPARPADAPIMTPRPRITSLPADWDSLVAVEFENVIRFLSPATPRNQKALIPLAFEASSFALAGGRLYKIDVRHGEKPLLRLVVPAKYRQNLFDERHSGKYGAHACGSKILAQLKDAFWWPKMCADCERWAKACVVCAYTRRSRKNVPPLMPVITSRPWELLCLDLLQLPKATTGEKYALVVIDHFTRFAMAFPLRDKTAELTARTLVERVFLPFGPSERIHHDKGTEFVNKVVQALVETFRMGQTTTAGYNPRCNGSCEKLNQQIIRMLSRTTVIPQEWPERIAYALYVFNCTRQEATGYPPFELLFGRSVRMPSEISADLVPGKYAVDIDDYRMIFGQNMSEALECARVKAAESSDRSKQNYDALHKSLAGKYKVGDRVMVQDPSGQQAADHKLSWKNSGPYRVVRVQKNNALLAPYGRAGADHLEVPLDRLVKVPDEAPELPFTRRPDRAKFISVSAISMSLQPLKCEVLALTTGSCTFNVPIGDKQWTSAPREVVIISQKSGMGLGIYDECKGACGADCVGVTLADIAPDGLASEGTFGLRIVPTFAHQIAVGRAAQVIDGMELGSFCEKMLSLPAEDVDRALGCIRLELPPTTPQLLAEQARLRKEKCATTRAALQLSGTRPLICITTETDDSKLYTSLQLRDGSIGECAPGTNTLGEAWEQARNDKGKPLLNDQFIILCSASEKDAFEKTYMSVTTVDNMLQAVAFARQNCFGGACMAVFVTLPTASENLLTQMLRFRKAMYSHPHVTVCFLPPPPIRTAHYGEVAAVLLQRGGGLYQIAPDGGSVLQLGRYGTGTDKRYVTNGAWSREGWQLVKVHATHVAGWLCFQERPRKTSSYPLRQMGKMELGGERKENPSTSTKPKDRLHMTLSGRIAKPEAAKPPTSSLTELLSTILSDAAHKASSSSSSAHSRSGLQRSAPSHNAKSATKKRLTK